MHNEFFVRNNKKLKYVSECGNLTDSSLCKIIAIQIQWN